MSNFVKMERSTFDAWTKEQNEMSLEIESLNRKLNKAQAEVAELKSKILEWKDGPARGGFGTAGHDEDGISQWYDGDRLIIIVETNSGQEMAIVDISADEDDFSVTDASSGDEYDAWGPESWSWYAKFTEKNLPKSAQNTTNQQRQ